MDTSRQGVMQPLSAVSALLCLKGTHSMVTEHFADPCTNWDVWVVTANVQYEWEFPSSDRFVSVTPPVTIQGQHKVIAGTCRFENRHTWTLQLLL